MTVAARLIWPTNKRADLSPFKSSSLLCKTLLSYLTSAKDLLALIQFSRSKSQNHCLFRSSKIIINGQTNKALSIHSNVSASLLLFDDNNNSKRAQRPTSLHLTPLAPPPRRRRFVCHTQRRPAHFRQPKLIKFN